MRNTFTFGDITSNDYGVFISGSGVYNAPSREYTAKSVPGRNGDLLLKGDRYSNITITYPAFIYSNFKKNVAEFRSALLATNGYARLQDTYHPDEYRVAYYEGDFEVEARQQNDAGEFEIEFICKPQRYMTCGEDLIEVANNGKLLNPTLFPAKPCISVEGYGQITVGHNVITINENIYPVVVIDSEIMDCYGAAAPPDENSAVVGTDVLRQDNYRGNANMIVSFSAGDFPTLPEGETGIEYDPTISAVWITPRWWHL